MNSIDEHKNKVQQSSANAYCKKYNGKIVEQSVKRPILRHVQVQVQLYNSERNIALAWSILTMYLHTNKKDTEKYLINIILELSAVVV